MVSGVAVITDIARVEVLVVVVMVTKIVALVDTGQILVVAIVEYCSRGGCSSRHGTGATVVIVIW